MSKLLQKSNIASLLKERFKDDSCQNISQIPSPSMLKDIDKAAKRVSKAITAGEKIAIVGDYDADGVISSVILSEFFDDIGKEIQIKIPNRFSDGYGLSEDIINSLDVDLIITVDNGISAVKASKVCKEKGIDLIITDHHTVPDTLPDAYAIVNPKQDDCLFPFSEICGAQVAWYLVAALKDELNIKYNLTKSLDILSIAIVADMMPLVDINRAMVKKGLKLINNSNRTFFKTVKLLYNKQSFKSEDISFLLAPLINSSGRIEDATLSYSLIKEQNEQQSITKLEYIMSLNNDRKVIESDLFLESIKMINSSKNIIIAWGEDWHEGVIGIVAARLSRKYKKPSIVFSITGDKAKGSARSVGSIDILEFITQNSEHLLGFGGHKGAAGMSILKSNLEEFKKDMEISMVDIAKQDFIEKKNLLGSIDISIIDFELLDILEYYEPYGEKNPKPHFLVEDVVVQNQKLLGATQIHQKIVVQSGSNTIDTIDFNFETQVYRGDKIKFSCTVSKNEFRGSVSAQLIVDELIFD